jgi:Zn-dependent peptidase ImmA (M78 family)
MSVRVEVSPALLQWARARSGIDDDIWPTRFPRYGAWVAGDASTATLDDPPAEVAASMRTILDWTAQTRHRLSSWDAALTRLRESAEAAGVLVMISGIAGSNAHRKLDPDEFRGFALADPYAPVVFVNGADSKAAQVFTLAHELTHLWLGSTALSDIDPESTRRFDDERWSNQVAAELLVPMDEFVSMFDTAGDLRSQEDLDAPWSRQPARGQLVAFLLDSDVLIRAKNDHYAFDFCPARPPHLPPSGACSPRVRRQSRRAGRPNRLTNRFPRRSFFLPLTAVEIPTVAAVNRWANDSPNYAPAAGSEFAAAADRFLVGHERTSPSRGRWSALAQAGGPAARQPLPRQRGPRSRDRPPRNASAVGGPSRALAWTVVARDGLSGETPRRNQRRTELARARRRRTGPTAPCVGRPGVGDCYR